MAVGLLKRLRADGFTARLVNGKVNVGPEERLTADLLAELRSQKDELRAALVTEAASSNGDGLVVDPGTGEALNGGGFPRNGRARSEEKSRHKPVPEGDLPRLPRSSGRIIPWPAPLAEEAFHGFVGDFVQAVDPHTEGDPAGVLLTLLIGIGNLIGTGTYAQVGPTKHPTRDNAVLIGLTSQGAKGESAAYPRELFRLTEPEWAKRICGGLSSGEGLIWRVRDPIKRTVPIRGKDKVITGYEQEVVDPGVSDKRWLCIETEFARVLQVGLRDGNTLSCQIRDAWDFSNFTNVVKTNAAEATDAHVSIIGHITPYELRKLLTETDAVNGFFNRFVPQCVRRSKSLPEGGSLLDLTEEARRLTELLSKAKTLGHLQRDAAAKYVWAAIYDDLRANRPGLLGSVTCRAAAHVLRFSTIYAAIDGSDAIGVKHLLASVAVWDRAFASARYIFGDAVGDVIADATMDALVERHPAGLSKEGIRSEVFQRNIEAKRIGQGLALLEEMGMAEQQTVRTGGRSREEWFARVQQDGQPVGILPKARKAAEEFLSQNYAVNAVSPSQARACAWTFRAEERADYAESPADPNEEIEEGTP